MALSPDITNEQIDEKSPIDVILMSGIKDNLERIDLKADLAGGSGFAFKVNGLLDNLALDSDPSRGIGLDSAHVATEGTIQSCSLFLNKKGFYNGDLTFDVKKYRYLGHSIREIREIYKANTQSISTASADLDTQSVTRAAADLNVESTSWLRPAVSVDWIPETEGAAGYVYVYFPDNVQVDDYYEENIVMRPWVKVVATDNVANEDAYGQIFEVNKESNYIKIYQYNNAVIETGGTVDIQLMLMSMNFSAAPDVNFAVGEQVEPSLDFAHNYPASLTIIDRMAGGNNLIFTLNNPAIDEEATTNGVLYCKRFSYNYLNPVPDTFAVGEKVTFINHYDQFGANNNGTWPILATNYGGGNNIIIYDDGSNSPDKVTPRAVIEGQAVCNRYVYGLSSDPTGFFNIGDKALLDGHDNAANNGEFEVVDVRFLATNNIVVYNESGVVQGAANGTVDQKEKAIIFKEDFAVNYTADLSLLELSGTHSGANDETNILVKEINRQSISPYNLIVELPSGVTQGFPFGVVYSETKSIFPNGPKTVYINQDKKVATFYRENGDIVDENILTDTVLQLDVIELPDGAEDLAVVVV